MPMLGKKQFSLVKALTNTGSDETVFTIPHTKEQFRSKEEYEKRLELYKQSIWTCRCTGHTTLTHEDAWKSEQAAIKMLKGQFQQCYEKAVLQIVHHSTESLDSLNDQAWTKLHQFLVEGEKVTFKINNGAKVLKGTVVGISPSTEDSGTASSKCNSPSSDKENSSDDKDKSPKKWTPPKLLTQKYSVKMDDGPIINSVPVEDLTRVERPPSKDLVRLFIRAHAVRSGTTSTSPWVVDEHLVKKYSLPSKFADFLLSPSKMAEAAKRAEELGKKRKRQSQDAGTAKKRKLDESSEKKKKKKEKLTPVSLNKKVKVPGKEGKDSDKKKKKTKKDKDGKEKTKKEKKDDTEKDGESVKKKTSPEKSKKSKEVISIDDSSDEERVSLAAIKKMKMKTKTNGDSDSDVPLSNLADQTSLKKKKSSGSAAATPNKKKTESPKKQDKKTPGTPKAKKSGEEKSPVKRKRRDSTDSDVPLSKLSPKKTPSTPKKSPGKSLKEQNEHTPQKKNKTTKSQEKSAEKKPRGRPKKGEEKSPSKPPKGLKQTTLLDMAAKKSGKPAGSGTTPKKSPAKPQTPLIVKKLIALNKEEDRQKFSILLKKAVLVLTPTQKKNLPSPIKEKVQRRMELMEEKRAIEKMSESEREAYFKEKKEKQKHRMKEKMKEKMKEMRQRYEDQDLKLQPLPTPKLVPTPENLPNELFGDVAMVTEFISSYSGLLMPESEYPIYTDALMKALAAGAPGFAYLSRVLSVLLQTLLQDEIAEDYSELKVPLSDIAVNPYTVSELVRLCLRKEDSTGSSSDNDGDEMEVPESLIQQLETQEFFQLECEEKLKILRGLCLRVMSTYSVQDYMEDKQREAIQLTKQKNTEMKGFNEKLKEKKEKPKMEDKPNAAVSMDGDAPTTNGPALTLTSFYGKKPEDSPADNSPADSQGEDGDNLVSIVKRRRILAAKAAQEKEERDLQRRLQKEKEFEEERQRRQREQFETKFKDSINLAKTVLRHTPIGYDRHHNRYWMFTHTTPGLFIEKGWISQDISYNPGNVPDERADDVEENTTTPTTPTGTPSKSGSPSKRLHSTKKKALLESTVPCCGQNLWFTFNSLKDLDALLHNLHPQGIREAALKTEVKKRYQDITRAIQGYQRNNLELRESEGNEEMLAGFRKELSDMELRLRNGGLGGVQNYSEWEARLMSSTGIPSLGACLLETQDAIMDKFLQKFMKIPKKEELEGGIKEEDEEEENHGEEAHGKGESSEDKKLTAAERRLQQWKDSITNCSTLSRLHVLLGMMDSCIKWEKSAENAKCKICRKKGDDDRLLLCDECNQAFHMYCLRPQLVHVPRGDWFCVACVPANKRRSHVPSRYGDVSESEDSEEDEVKNTNCEECGGEAGQEEGEELVVCHKCPCVYHLDCHQPPLRRMPRGVWECSDCKNGVRRRNKKRPQRKAAASRKSYKAQESADDESEVEEEEESDEESSPEPTSKTTSSRLSSRGSSSKVSSGRRSSRNSGANSSNNTPVSRSSRHSGDYYDDTPPPRSRRAPSDLSLCEDILQRLMKHSSSWPFLEPVNKKEVPDYHQIIKKPMDFQTMLKKCARLSYSSPQEFVDDAILVFSNAAKYNEADSDVYSCMKEVEKFFSELLAKYLPDYASTQHFISEKEDANNARTRRGRRN